MLNKKMEFKHYATGEIIRVKVVVVSLHNETVVEDLGTGKLMVVYKNKDGKYQIKGTSFFKVG